jgi:acyl dehydratase
MRIEEMKIGDELTSDNYVCITQQQIQAFADATGDHQWIHLDEEKCKQYSPYQTTIAHGFLTVSLMPQFFGECLTIDASTTTMINYGVDNLRFIEAVRSNDEISYVFTLRDIEPKANGKLYKFEAYVDIKGREKPALVGVFLSLILSAE